MDTLPLDFDDREDPPQPHSKRLRARTVRIPATGQAQRKARTPPALLRTPQQRMCGFCGHRETVLEEAVLCSQCGSVILREE